MVALLLLASPAVALAQSRAGSTRVVASGALDGPGNRVLSLTLTPTADGRAVGTLRFVDHAAKLRLRAQRIETLRVEDGVTTILGTATVGRARGNQLTVLLRAPVQPGGRASVRLDVAGPAGSYQAEGELVGGLTRLPAATRRPAAPAVQPPAPPAPQPPPAAQPLSVGPLPLALAPPPNAGQPPAGATVASAVQPSPPLLVQPPAAPTGPPVAVAAAPPSAPATSVDETNAVSPVALALAALAAQVAGIAPPSPATPADQPPAPTAPGAAPPSDLLASAALALVQRLDVLPTGQPDAARAPSAASAALPAPVPAPAPAAPSNTAPPDPPTAALPASVAAVAATAPASPTADEPSPLTMLLGRLAATAAPAAAAALADQATHTTADPSLDRPAPAAATGPNSIPGTNTAPAQLSPLIQALGLLGARLAEDPELAGPARAIAQELRPLIAQEAAAHPAETQAIARSLEVAVAAAQRERGPGADVAFAALLDRAREWRRALGPDGADQRIARDLFGRYRSFSESWARAAAAAAAERTPPDAWAAATALGISLIEQDGVLGGLGQAAVARELATARTGGADGLLPLATDDLTGPLSPVGTRRPAVGAGGRPGGGRTSSARLGETDFPIPVGHFFTQTGRPERAGFAVTDQDGVPFWSAFQQLGGVPVLGYPASHRFEWDGFTVQVFQRAVLQWRPESGEVYLVNVLDRLHAGGLDAWLLYARQTPAHALEVDPLALDAYPGLQAAYLQNGLGIHGLPTSGVVDMGNHYALRTQRTVLQFWKQDVPWASAGEITIALAGDMLKESGLLLEPWALEPLPWIESS